jgi:hypothetical protein
MRVDDILYFSPHFRFCDLNLDEMAQTIQAFQDRVEGFYLTPAHHLLEAGDAFGCGLLCCATIDLLARYWYNVGETTPTQYRGWLECNIPEFASPDPVNPDKTLGNRFYKDFRCGLVHEGRIKQLGQFGMGGAMLGGLPLISIVDSAIIIDPGRLLNSICESFDRYCAKLAVDSGARAKLMDRFRKDFEKELSAVKKVSESSN